VLGRIAAAFGAPLSGGQGEIVRLFPAATRIAAAGPAALARLGMPLARARTIVALAEGVVAGEIALTPEADVDATLERLLGIRGIGTWTAHYIAMRALRWPDAFLEGDLVVRKVLGVAQPARALALAESWRPWRAYAVMHLWRSTQ
jgi:AraC family transcriptional regulator of adaptative response / DNA-3-methyladenine glycosylase II